jgi:hypothetical protein
MGSWEFGHRLTDAAILVLHHALSWLDLSFDDNLGARDRLLRHGQAFDEFGRLAA